MCDLVLTDAAREVRDSARAEEQVRSLGKRFVDGSGAGEFRAALKSTVEEQR